MVKKHTLAPSPTPPEADREQLLDNSGLTHKAKVRLTRKTLQRLEEMLDAKETKFFAFQGQVGEVRHVDDNETRLKAIDASYRLLGIAAPRQEQKVTVVHKLELPAWGLADSVDGQVIEIEGKVE